MQKEDRTEAELLWCLTRIYETHTPKPELPQVQEPVPEHLHTYGIKFKKQARRECVRDTIRGNTSVIFEANNSATHLATSQGTPSKARTVSLMLKEVSATADARAKVSCTLSARPRANRP